MMMVQEPMRTNDQEYPNGALHKKLAINDSANGPQASLVNGESYERQPLLQVS